MKRDVGYALIAALTLSALAALWVLVKAPELANPNTQMRTRGLSGSVPIRPVPPRNDEAIRQAVAVLDARDLFQAAAPADMATLRRLSTARIAPPVELVPVEATRNRTRPRYAAAPPRPEPIYRAAPPASIPPRPVAPPPVQPRIEQPRPPVPVPTPSSQQVITMRDPRFPLTLRGIFPDPRNGVRAHIALPNGRVVSTGPGGVIEGFQVVAINPASIVVQGRGGPPYRLEMPGY